MNGDEKKDQNVNDPGNGGFERGRISIHSVRARVVLLFAVAVGLIIALLRVDFVNKFVTGAFSLLSPVIIGVTLAYVLNPVCNFFRRIFYKAFTKNEKRSKEKAKKHARRLSIFITVFLLLAIIAALLFLIVPELTDSVSKLVSNIPEMLKSASSWIKNNLPSETVLGINFSATVEKFIDEFNDFVNNWVTENGNAIVNGAWNAAVSAVSYLFNAIVALIVCIYALMERERFVAHSKKIVYALFSTERANNLVSMTRYGNSVFGTFISAKLLTSAALGVITFIFMSAFGMPYALLSSVIVAVTNMVPFFGPIIGGAIVFFIVVVTDWKDGLIFGIYAIIIQQIEGNVVEPLLMEDRTGISKFWITFALLLFGGMFGIPGMLFATPLFAVIYYGIKVFVEKRLAANGFPQDNESYIEAGSFDVQTKESRPAAPHPATKKPRLSIKAFLAALVGKKVTDNPAVMRDDSEENSNDVGPGGPEDKGE